MSLDLAPTPDVLKEIGQCKTAGQVVVGFALETDDAVENARKKLAAKNLDMIALNTVGADTGFDSNTNELTLIRPGCEPETLPLASKDTIARQLLEKVLALL